MKKFYLLLLIFVPLFLLSCSSGKRAYESGNYSEAVLKAVNRLRKNPDHKKSKETLRKSYPLAVELLENNANNTLAGINPSKYRDALRMYQEINSLADEIRRSPGALRVVPNPKYFAAKVDELKRLAAEESYQRGLVALNRNTREDAKTAYYLFMETQEFMPGYKDVRQKLDEAKFEATIKVVIEQIPVPARYDLSGKYFQDRIESYLSTQFKGSEFVRFYTPNEAQQLPYVDQYLRLQFDDFVIGETHTEKVIETVTRDSVVVATVTENRKKRDVYGTVSAKLTTYRKQVISRGLFSMQVFDSQNNTVLRHRKFNPEFVWYSAWGSFNGDERALTDEQLAICQRSEVPPPPPQELFISFTKPIYDQLIAELNSYYSRY